MVAQNTVLSITKRAIESKVHISFNNDHTTIKINSDTPIHIKQIEVYNILSSLMYLEIINAKLSEHTFYIGTIPNGIYFVRLHCIIQDQEHFFIKRLCKCSSK